MAVRKRKDTGRWYYDLQIRGVRYRGSIPEARNKAQAERAEARIRLELFEQRFGDGISKNFAEFVREEYEPWALANKRSFATADRFIIERLVVYFKDYALSEISPLMIEKFKRERANSLTLGGKKRKPASVNRELATLSRILSMARDNGFIQQNPCSKVKRLREDNARTRHLTKTEEAQLMAVLKGRYERLRPFVVLALNTGMRQGEIAELAWPQIDWERNLIHVVNTKNAHNRTIPMNPTVKDLLLRLWRNRDQGGVRVFKDSAKVVSLSFRGAVKRAGLVDFRFHDLRHTFATRLAEAGTDAFTLAALLGHRTLSMTARYTHPTDDGKRRAIAALDEYNENLGQENGTVRMAARASEAV